MRRAATAASAGASAEARHPRSVQGALRGIVRALPLGFAFVVVLLGAFAPLLAHDAPLIVQSRDGWRFPVFESFDSADVLALGIGMSVSAALLARRRVRVALALVMALMIAAGFVAPHAQHRNLAAESFDDRSVIVLETPLRVGPSSQHLETALRRLPPLTASEHLLGTDGLGRDVLARLIHGLRTSLLLAFGAVIASLGLGILLGSISALGPRWVDRLLESFWQALSAIPSLFALLTLRGTILMGPLVLGAILGALRAPITARLVRDGVRRVLRQPFIEASRSFGRSWTFVLVRHLLPHALAPVLVESAFVFTGAVLAEATLSFLGLTPGGRPSLGELVAEGQSAFLRTPWILAAPALLLVAWLASLQSIAERWRRRLQHADGIDP